MLYIKLKESSFQISTPLVPTGLKTNQTNKRHHKQTNSPFTHQANNATLKSLPT